VLNGAVWVVLHFEDPATVDQIDAG
jgi:hypothetical protein